MKIEKLQNQLSLENNGALSFFFVGTGSAFTKKYFQNNALVIKGKNHILIDCGTLCPYAIERFNAHITQVRNFFITHSHADHIGGLEEVAFTNYYGTRQRPTFIIDDEYKKILWEDSLRGGLGYSTTWEKTPATFDDYFLQQTPEQIKVNGHTYDHAVVGDADGIDLKIFDTIHCRDKDTRGKSFRTKGVVVDSRILFTGDTEFNPKQLEQILSDFNIEYIFHECASVKKPPVHTGLEELQTLGADVRKKIYLCHHGDALTSEDVKSLGFGGFAEAGCYYNFDE